MDWAFLPVFGLVGGRILASRMLAPLARISAAAGVAASGSLSHRIRLPARREEFRDLADGFDAKLARLETHVDAQRRFAANASHELRTPPAITRTLLDVVRADPQRDGERVDRLHAVHARAIELTEALLLLSRTISGPPPGRTSICPSWLEKPPRRCFPSRGSAASPSRPAETSPRPADHPRSFCR